MKRPDRAWVSSCLLIVAVSLSAVRPGHAAERNAAGPSIVVFAAASLTDALQELGDDFTKSAGIAVKFSFAASSTLARQIESGAPADLFLSADTEWMDYLQTRNLIQPGTRHELLGNSLVLVAPAASTVTLTIEPHFGLAAALGKGRLATGDPDSVPVGRYAKAALTSLDVWTSIEPRLVRADNVRAALAFVDRNEVPLGIVYKTDALVDKGVRIVDTFPAATYPPITYPIALKVGAKTEAGKFADYLRTPGADAVFVKYGFVPLH
jgi:molybdate transport system substrate-binding protein